MSHRHRLGGKVALVTGAGGSAIGRATCKRFAEEGAILICADRDKDAAAGTDLVAQLRAGGGEAMAVVVDLQSHESVHDMIQNAAERYGRLDVLFNLMVWGRARAAGAWQWTLNATFAPTYFGTFYGAEVMSLHGGGSIINASSVAGVVLSPAVQPLPALGAEAPAMRAVLGAGSYGAAKSTVGMLTREYAVRYGRRGVRVNAIAPGFIATPYTLSAFKEDFYARLQEAIPMGRLGQPEDIGATAAFLASDDARYMTGQVLVVDGGYSERSA